MYTATKFEPFCLFSGLERTFVFLQVSKVPHSRSDSSTLRNISHAAPQGYRIPRSPLHIAALTFKIGHILTILRPTLFSVRSASWRSLDAEALFCDKKVERARREYHETTRTLLFCSYEHRFGEKCFILRIFRSHALTKQ